MLSQVFIGITTGLGAMCLAMFVLKWAAPGPKGLGIANGKLNPCENSPNCVCSEDSRPAFTTERIAITEPPDPENISRKLSTLPRTTIVRLVQGPATDTTLGTIPAGAFLIHAESRSLLIGFVDDIQIVWIPGLDGLQIRSSSRAGYSDLGVNKTRISQIRSLLNQ